jgi:deoxyribodipyrimidine photolyase-related protein
MPPVRQLLIVLGDQLDHQSPLFHDSDARQDVVWMAEVVEESEHVPSSKMRTALFLSAMRHFAAELRRAGRRLDYRKLDDPSNQGRLAAELRAALDRHHPQRVRVIKPGDWRVEQSLLAAAPVEILPDPHFYSTPEEFHRHAAGRKQLRLEYFYREMRRKHGVLMDGGEPAGGAWNYDAANRESFGRQGPGRLPAPRRFEPDAITREVMDLVNRRFANHPGRCEDFDWPVTAAQARAALDDFVAHRLPWFGRYQDAMWAGEPWLYHSRISSSLNLKLLNPRQAVDAAEKAYREGCAPLPAAEGFVRQILGWREYVRGVYWQFMPEYVQHNALNAHQPLPEFYWTAQTPMNCLHEALDQTLRHGYAHHIQRLMVTGLYALLLGVEPRAIHEWYLSVYVDAVEWVELPNTLGMSQFADGGIMASKPYAATGKYIQRMSNYCAGCRFDPAEATGETACPFTTLYWDFLLRNEKRLRVVPRMELQLKNIARLTPQRRREIAAQAARWKSKAVKA